MRGLEESKTTENKFKQFDFERMHQHGLKIFSDVFEAIAGAIYVDSGSLETASKVILPLLLPYIPLYATAEQEEHPRTAVKILWDRIEYLKQMKFLHETKIREFDTQMIAWVKFPHKKKQRLIFSHPYETSEKKKCYSFYKLLLKIV